jgi:hypothetical protein
VEKLLPFLASQYGYQSSPFIFRADLMTGLFPSSRRSWTTVVAPFVTKGLRYYCAMDLANGSIGV